MDCVVSWAETPLLNQGDVHLDGCKTTAQLVMQLPCDADGFLFARPLEPGCQGAQLRFGSAQGLFSLLSLGNITQNHREQLIAADLGLRNGGLDREFPTVGPQCREVAKFAHCPIRHPGACKRAYMRTVHCPQPGGNEPLQGLPKRFDRSATKHTLGRCVKEHHPLRFVDANDSVHGRVDNPLKAPLTFPQIQLCSLLFADVTSDL